MGEFDVEGIFHDTIPDGVIKYYKLGTNELVATNQFKNGKLEGEAINYFGPKIIQRTQYKNGERYGFSCNS